MLKKMSVSVRELETELRHLHRCCSRFSGFPVYTAKARRRAAVLNAVSEYRVLSEYERLLVRVESVG